MDGIQNSTGQTAVIHYQSTNPLIEFGKPNTPSYRGYKFVTQHCVCLCWVNNEDVQRILDIKGGCCGNKKSGIYRLANEMQVRVWTYGGR